MPILVMPNRLSYDMIVQAELLPAAFECPLMVLRLPLQQRSALMADPLTPVSRHYPSYEAQRVLLQSMSAQSYCQHLHVYCLNLRLLTPRAWEFVATEGKPDYTKLPAAVADGTLSRSDAASISALYAHWVELQRHVPQQPRVVFKSSRTPQVAAFGSARHTQQPRRGGGGGVVDSVLL